LKLLAAGLLLSIAPVSAHHSFSADFDAKRPVRLEGTVSKVDWTNPHVGVYLDVTSLSGEIVRWMVEAASPNALLRKGVNKNSVTVGMLVVVDGYQAKSGAHRANGLDIILPGGKKLLLRSDGADPH
jgi:hypothetical protein